MVIKLIRDKLSEVIDKNRLRIADKSEMELLLYRKAHEELEELFANPCNEEMADVIEIIYAISDYFQFNRDDVVKAKKEKFDKRGGFSRGLILK